MAKKKRRNGGNHQRENQNNAAQGRQELKQALGKELTAEVGGKTYTLVLEAFDDVELLDELNQINNGNPLPTLSVLRRILGHEQAAQALEDLRDENGRAGAIETGEFILKLVSEANPNS